jgi:hypothetical protein
VSRCTAAGRHWYTARGRPGLRLPACARCGHPNPRPLTPAQWEALAAERARLGYPFADAIEAELNRHLEGQ